MKHWLIILMLTACEALCRRDGFTGGHMLKGHCICEQDCGTLPDFIYRRVTLGEHLEEYVPPEKEEKKFRYSELYGDH